MRIIVLAIALVVPYVCADAQATQSAWNARVKQTFRLRHQCQSSDSIVLDPIVITASTNPKVDRDKITKYYDEKTIRVDHARRQQIKAWPPWPFNMLSHKSQQPTPETSEKTPSIPLANKNDVQYQTGAQLLWAFTRESARAGVKNMQTLGSQLWFHLPPAAPPFVLLAAIPRRKIIMVENELTTQYIVPLFSNAFARNVALSGLGLAILSWSHYEVYRKRRLAPLPLNEAYRDINRAILPPFLPEACPVEYHTTDRMANDLHGEYNGNENEDGKNDNMLPPKMQRHWNAIIGRAPKPASFHNIVKQWRRSRKISRQERQNARRLSIYDELVALQSLKKKTSRRRKSPYREPELSLGYALVTGASRGIGRAIAVELARWEIPLILVARDIDRLTALAYDLEACYGVKCCVLEADLAKSGVAEKVFKATQDAGLRIDILVNNAGISKQGISVDLPAEDVNSMIQLNALSVSTLTHLYGKEMKERRRGRIMAISSICGAVAGLPSVAVYAATKAFENTLTLSIAKELEPYGVGVTCIMPGAVRDTTFRSRSNSNEALCWKIPFYPKKPQSIAEWSVRSMLRGDTETTLGWQNRAFLKVFKPVLPQRLHNLVAEVSWNPVRLPWQKQSGQDMNSGDGLTEVDLPPPPTMVRPRYGHQAVPRLLELEQDLPDPIPLTKESDESSRNETHLEEPTSDVERESMKIEPTKTTDPATPTRGIPPTLNENRTSPAIHTNPDENKSFDMVHFGSDLDGSLPPIDYY